MNFNENFSGDSLPNSNDIMSMAMSEIHDILIEPMSHKMTEEENAVITLIGLTFKIMAEKATLYEQSLEDKHSDTKENDFYRN